MQDLPIWNQENWFGTIAIKLKEVSARISNTDTSLRRAAMTEDSTVLYREALAAREVVADADADDDDGDDDGGGDDDGDREGY